MDKAEKLSKATDFLIIFIVWICAIAIVNPWGNFPLNDDWSYALVAKTFVDKGEFLPTGWVSMPLISNILWGAIFIWHSEFSFEALRLSTITIALIGLLCAYLLARDGFKSRSQAVLLSLIIGFNPIYFALSHTFMTDVGFSVLILLAVYFYYQYLKSRLNLFLCLTIIFGVLSVLSRQVALPILFGLIFAPYFQKNFSKINFLKLCLPLFFASTILFGFNQWLNYSGHSPYLYVVKSNELFSVLQQPVVLLKNFFKNIFISFLYIGLFLCPILVWQNPSRKIVIRSAIFTFCFLVALAILSIGDEKNYILPLLVNVLQPGGIGPYNTINYIGLVDFPLVPKWIWWVITALSIFGSSLGVFALHSGIGSTLSNLKTADGLNIIATFKSTLLISVIAYLFPLFAIGTFFDRYLLPIIPLLGLLALKTPQLPKKKNLHKCMSQCLAFIIVFFFLALSVAMVKDYMAWNRARWNAIDYLVFQEKINKSEIDGGFEYSGLNFYDPIKSAKNFVWAQDPKYAISFNPLMGYESYKKFQYHRVLPWSDQYIYVLKRLN